MYALNKQCDSFNEQRERQKEREKTHCPQEVEIKRIAVLGQTRQKLLSHHSLRPPQAKSETLSEK
jgi:hypothetical protein